MASLASFSRLAASTYSSACSMVGQPKIAISCSVVAPFYAAVAAPAFLAKSHVASLLPAGRRASARCRSMRPRAAARWAFARCRFRRWRRTQCARPRRVASCRAEAGLASVATRIALGGP